MNQTNTVVGSGDVKTKVIQNRKIVLDGHMSPGNLLPNNSNPSSSETIPPPTKKLRTLVPEENATPQSNKKLKTLNPQNDDDDNEKTANHEVPKVTFKCDRCSILFDSVEEKERHMKLGLGKLKQFQCPKCEFRACHYNGAKEHFAKIHLKRPINTNPPQEKPE